MVWKCFKKGIYRGNKIVKEMYVERQRIRGRLCRGDWMRQRAGESAEFSGD